MQPYNPDPYGWRKHRGPVQTMDPASALTEQPAAAAQAQATGGFQGLKGALDPRNPLLMLALLVAFFAGLIALSFHIRVGHKSVSAAVGSV